MGDYWLMNRVQFVMTFLILFSGIPLFAREFSGTVRSNWESQYRELTEKIEDKRRAGMGKFAVPDPMLDNQARILSTDNDPVDVVIRRTEALLDKLSQLGLNVDSRRKKLAEIRTRAETNSMAKAVAQNRVTLFQEVSALRRQAAMDNPLLDFDDLIFVERDICCSGHGGGQHICDQYYGFNARFGGGLFLLKDFKDNPIKIDIVETATVQNGRLAGQSLNGGGFLSPELSLDAQTVFFAWTEPADRKTEWTPELTFSIFRVDLDGSNLKQLTDGPHDDFDPCHLPNGRVVFISTRRGGYGRCHGRKVPTYTLFSMKDDGSDLFCIDWHETNEWQPSVDNDGRLVYTRWDYVDRSDCIAHHIWHCNPDGTDPRSYHGNYPTPHSTATGSNWINGEMKRPFAEMNIRAIPDAPNKYIATSAPHHGESFGALVMLDLSIPDDNVLSQVNKITDGPMSHDKSTGDYGTAWPLSEDFYLCNYQSGIYLIDKFGNRDLIYESSSEEFRPIDPIPVKSRTYPQMSTKTWQGERSDMPDHQPATISINNVRISDAPLPDSVQVKWMRIVQVFPKMTPNKDKPRIGFASESLARMPLGIVPVEEDGSVYCEAPIEKAVYFQLLDEKGMAVHSMRSITYVHPGEQLSCLGCHEDKWTATPANPNPSAMGRPPSSLRPEVVDGAIPFNFHRLVKPLFQDKCVDCHTREGKGPDMTYRSLEPYAFGYPGSRKDHMKKIIGGTRTTPLRFGAHEAKLIDVLEEEHKTRVTLTNEEYRRITLWLDLNSNEFGACEDLDRQRNGEIVWPSLDVDRRNPLGTEFPFSRLPVSGIRIIPGTATAKPNETIQFTVTGVDLVNRPVQIQTATEWSITDGGSISSDGLFQANSTEGGPYVVKAVTEHEGTQYSAQATLFVTEQEAELLPPGYIKTLLVLKDGTSPYLPIVNGEPDCGSPTSVIDGQAMRVGDVEYEWTATYNPEDMWVAEESRDQFYACFALEILKSSVPVKFALRHDDDINLWVNGTEIASVKGWDGGDELVTESVQLDQSTNLVIARLKENSGGNHFGIRILDENGDDANSLLYVPMGLDVTPVVPAVPRVSPHNLKPAVVVIGNRLHIELPDHRGYTVSMYNARGAMIRKVRFRGPGRFHTEIHEAGGLYVVRLERDGRPVQTLPVVSGMR